MKKNKISEEISVWRFRREITLSTILHLTVILVMVITGWGRLQKELALIKHDLTRLIESDEHIREHIKNLNNRCRSYDFRINGLEEKMSGRKSASTTSNQTMLLSDPG